MKRLLLSAATILGVFLGSWLLAHATNTFAIQQGGTGTTTAPSAQLLYGGGGTAPNQAYQSVATTTASCSGSASCTAFTIIGSSPVTISASGGSGGTGTVSTSTNETPGTLSYWTSNSATPALLGKVATTTASCSGNVSCSAFTVIGASPITINGSAAGGTGLATSSPWTPGFIAYVINNSTVGSAATSSLTASGVLSLSNPAAIIGASGAALTVTGGSNGQVLGWLSGVPTWTASSSVAAGTGISISLSGAQTTVTNTGVTSLGNGTGITCSGTAPGSCSLASISAGVLGTPVTGIPTSQATSTLYGVGTGGMVLGYSGGLLVPLATTTLSTISGTLNLSNQVSNTLGAANGGTGSTTLSGLLKGNGTGVVQTGVNGTDFTLITAKDCTGTGHVLSVTAAGVFTCSADSGGGGGTQSVATSTAATAGNLAYWTSTGASPETLGKVATTTLTFSGFPATIPAGYGTLVGGSNTTFTWWGLATSSNLTAGQLLMSNGAGNVSSTATGTISNGTNITVTNGGTASVLGANITINLSGTVAVANGGTGTTTGVAGQLAYWNGGATNLQALGTSTVSCTGNVTCTAFTIPGAAAITINGTGGGGSGGTWSTTTSQTAGNLINYPNNNTDIVAIGGSATTTARFYFDPNISLQNPLTGIGTTSPWGQYSIGFHNLSPTIPSFLIASSSTGVATSTEFIDINGNIGIGTSSPASLFSINGVANFRAATTSFSSTGGLDLLAGCFAIRGVCVSGGGGGATPAGTGGQVQYANGGATALAAVSTTTLTFSSFPANQVGTLGTLIGGANTSLTWWGLSTSTNLSAGQVPFASSASALATNNNFFWDNNMQTLGVGTSTPRASLTVASSTGVQLLLTDGLSTNLAPWYHRVINGNFYIGTSSPTTFATSTNPILSIIPNSTSNATTTFSFTDWVLKQTSPVAFSILDAFSTPTVLVNTASTTGSAFTVVATTSTASQIYGNTAIKLFDIDSFGNFSASSTAPTLSSGQIDGTNNGGRVTNCSSACTVTFANGGWPKSPECSADPESGSVVNTFSYVITKTTLVVTETGLGSFDYHCGIGN